MSYYLVTNFQNPIYSHEQFENLWENPRLEIQSESDNFDARFVDKNSRLLE